MTQLKSKFTKDFSRSIETVIKADDRSHVLQEVDEYVVTKDVSLQLTSFFEAYKEKRSKVNGVWISGFFGSGKSHLLKILSYILTNKEFEGKRLGEIFASKIVDDEMLKGDVELVFKTIRSESILFNIDQQAQITSKSDKQAILQVFYKVFYDHRGYFGSQAHVAEFEAYLDSEGKYEDFKLEFAKVRGREWVSERKNYVDPRVAEALAKACSVVYDRPVEDYEDYLDDWEDKLRFSIEDFGDKVREYISTKGEGFRLNFFVDEVGQFIAENTGLMLNLQSIAETLNTKCDGTSWIIVTSQEDLESLVGDDSGVQSDDFSKIQGRFKVRMPLTSNNVDEVIEKRLLEKNPEGNVSLSAIYSREFENLRTILHFSQGGIQFKGYQGQSDFVSKYPFVPYQFDLFQQCIKSLSRHNVFQGRHASVGERSMLGVFQEVLKASTNFSAHGLVSFDAMFEGIRSTLRMEAQSSILLAEKQLKHNPLAIRSLKVLFLIKYFEKFSATLNNVCVLLLADMSVDVKEHNKSVEEALNLLEAQTYIQKKGEIFEYLTDDEKDIENEIKSTNIEEGEVSSILSEMLFAGVLGESSIKYQENGQSFDFTKMVDHALQGRERDLKIEVVSMNSSHYDNDSYFTSNSMANNTMVIKLAEDKRLIQELRLAIQTDRYIKQKRSSADTESVKRILQEKGQQNTQRKRDVEKLVGNLIAKSDIYIGGSVNTRSKSADGKTRLIETFQDVVGRNYSKLSLLGRVEFNEAQLHKILSDGTPELFGEDPGGISQAEKEVLNFITRRKQQHDRTTIADVREHFSKGQYGWPSMAGNCLVAYLYAKGKIEAKRGTDILTKGEFTSALNSNRQWGDTLLEPQIEFVKVDVDLLKAVHSELFDGTNTGTDPKAIAEQFKLKLDSLSLEIAQLLQRKEDFSFLSQLEPMKQKVDEVASFDYAKLIESLKEHEDDLLDPKEELLDPIRTFWNGNQRKILEDVKVYVNGNRANFAELQANNLDILEECLASYAPYKGNIIRQAKESMEAIQKETLALIGSARKAADETLSIVENSITSDYTFKALNDSEKSSLLKPLGGLRTQVSNERFIVSLRSIQNERIPELKVELLNHLQRIAEEQGRGAGEGGSKYVSINSTRSDILFEGSELKDENDVDAYLEAVKKSLMKEINQSNKITL
jgi:hypothetical protein